MDHMSKIDEAFRAGIELGTHGVDSDYLIADGEADYGDPFQGL